MAAATATAPEKKIVQFPLLTIAPWAIAAGLALAAVWLGSQNFSLRAENANIQTERQLAETAYKIAKNQLTERSLIAENMINDLGNKLRKSEDLARLKVTALASLAGNTKQAQVIAVWDPEQQTGLLTMEKLPAIRPDRTRPWYSARSTLPSADLTAKVPMIEATIATPPSTNG